MAYTLIIAESKKNKPQQYQKANSPSNSEHVERSAIENGPNSTKNPFQNDLTVFNNAEDLREGNEWK